MDSGIGRQPGLRLSRQWKEPMSFRIERDDRRHRLRVTLADPLTDADAIGVLDHQASTGAWSYGVLCDTRNLTKGLPRAAVLEVVHHVEELVHTHGQRGPVAIVARSGALIGVSEAYAMDEVAHGRQVAVFWAPEEATEWLDEQKPAAP